jgi:polysaccharide export outer membrane protein
MFFDPRQTQRKPLLAPRDGALRPFRRRLAGALFSATVALVSPSASAAYLIQQGDTIEISVSGLPELRHRSTVQPDGAIAFPLFNAVTVEGLTPSELRLEVQRQLARKIYRLHTSDGREVLTVIQPEEVSAEIVGYRPIYVTGDVAKPGEQTFRPEMSVQQAVVLAGGAELGQARVNRSYRDRASVQGDLESAAVDRARSALRAARLTAELNGHADVGAVDLAGIGLPKERVQEIEKSEAEILSARTAEYQREHDFLEAAVTQAADRIAVMEKQRQQEEEGSRADTIELQRLVDLLSRGQEINPRVTDARRALLLSSTRALQVNVELLELKRQQSESARNVRRFEEERRIGLLKELQEAMGAKTMATIKSRALEAELNDLNRGPSPDSSGESLRQTVHVIRRTRNDSKTLAVDDDFLLMPGDVIEVTVQAPEQSAALAR